MSYPNWSPALWSVRVYLLHILQVLKAWQVATASYSALAHGTILGGFSDGKNLNPGTSSDVLAATSAEQLANMPTTAEKLRAAALEEASSEQWYVKRSESVHSLARQVSGGDVAGGEDAAAQYKKV